MENKATTGSEPGSVTTIQQHYFTSTYKYIRTDAIAALMWLSMVGGLL